VVSRPISPVDVHHPKPVKPHSPVEIATGSGRWNNTEGYSSTPPPPPPAKAYTTGPDAKHPQGPGNAFQHAQLFGSRPGSRPGSGFQGHGGFQRPSSGAGGRKGTGTPSAHKTSVVPPPTQTSDYAYKDSKAGWSESPAGGAPVPAFEKLKELEQKQSWPQQQSHDTQAWSQQQQQVQHQDSQTWTQEQPPQDQYQHAQNNGNGQHWPQDSQTQQKQGDNQQWTAQNHPPTTVSQGHKPQHLQIEDPKVSINVPGGWPQSYTPTPGEETNIPGGWPQLTEEQHQPQLPIQSQDHSEASGPPRTVGGGTPALSDATVLTPATSVTMTQPPSHEQQEPDPLRNLEPFYQDSVQRYIVMIKAEAAATRDEEKLRVFTDFMEHEYYVRGQRYPLALGEPPSRQSSVYGRLPQYGGRDEERDSKEKLGLLPEGALGPTQRSRSNSSAVPPAEIILPVQSEHIEMAAPHTQWTPEKPKTPVSYVETKPPSPKPRHKPVTLEDPPISPEPLVIRKRPESMVAQSLNKGHAAFNEEPVSPPSAQKNEYKAFNPASPPSPTRFSSGASESQYVPFNGTETRAASPPKQTQESTGIYKPYNPVAQGGRNSSPAPGGSEFVAYDPKRASTFMAGGPGQQQPKRNSMGPGYPLSRSETMVDSPTSQGGSHPFGPLKGAKTSIDGYQLYSQDAYPPSSGGSSTIFSTPGGGDEVLDKKRQSYFPAASAPNPALDTLSAVLPASRAPRSKETKVMDDVRQTIDSIGEDFSFIEDINRAYAESAKKRRRKLDEERRARQEQHEQVTDELFADQQIGYGDIKEMEGEFKAKEARKEAKEEEDEYEIYCTEVFSKVYDKIQEGITGLMEKYYEIQSRVPTTVAGKDRWVSSDSVELTELMEGLLELSKFIETRHGKVQSAILERDKKFKKTVIQPLYASGNIGKMKSMEKHFEESEKKAYVTPFPFVLGPVV
jgi:hypothetical protein